MKTALAALCVCAALSTSACIARVYDPITGKPVFEGEIEEDPTPERAKELFAMLEQGLQRNLEALREANRTGNQQAQQVCLANMAQIADWKEYLTSQMSG